MRRQDLNRLHQVAGLITFDESARLYDLAAKIPSWSAIVEIGSHTGRSTLWLAAGTANGLGAHVTACDPFPDPRPGWDGDDPFELQTGDEVLAKFSENVTANGSWDRITMLRVHSFDLAPIWVNPIGMLFIDGYHGYGDVKRDCEDWLPKIVPGGVLAMHDWFDDPDYSHESQVAQALRDTWNEDEWERQEQVDNLFVAVRR